jgi:hypothetical protein
VSGSIVRHTSAGRYGESGPSYRETQSGRSQRIPWLRLDTHSVGEDQSGNDARVLIEAGAFRQAPQGGFNTTHSNIQILVGSALGVDAVQREQASVPKQLIWLEEFWLVERGSLMRSSFLFFAVNF